MCGICGIVSSGVGQPVDRHTLTRMCRLLTHRGPDDEGFYCDDHAGLGMRRLSIIDLVTGHQPMCNEDETIWLVFNGEIYNHQELRSYLESKGHLFRSSSDSEVIVHAYEEFGDECVDQFNGMFAFAIWDRLKRRLLLVRDRLGIKPLYYAILNDQLLFGSELKAVIAHPDAPREIDIEALDLFLSLEYIPAPKTIISGIRKLPPGHRLVYQDGQAHVERYWNIHEKEIDCSESDCVEQLAELIQDSVQKRLMSDVPIGAFLSGGIDSSTVVAFMKSGGADPIRAFSIGFEDDTYNELAYARMSAGHFGAIHHTEILQPDIVDLAQKLVGHLDEPLADFSIFPTYLVSELASRYVKVVLSGDGGDEVFAGYDTYVAERFDTIYSNLPSRLRQNTLPRIMSLIPPQPAKKGLINKTKRFVEGAALDSNLQHSRWMLFLNSTDRGSLYQPWLKAELNGYSATTLLQNQFDKAASLDPLTQQQYVDIKTYLADNILTKVDRMSMAVSLEARVPLLDHRIVEFALNLPNSLKLNRLKTKVALRKVAANRVPAEILNKPKQGFSIPLKHWLNGPLKPMMTDLLSTETIRARGYFEPQTVTRWIQEHLDGRANHSHRLWALMVIELWQQRVLDAASLRA
jgi:asparagine synthase (glutamine-hydrolysing)